MGAPSAGAQSINTVGLELLERFTTGGGGRNFALAPFSIQAAMAMTATGAAGETLAEMNGVLGITSSESGFAESLGEIASSLDAASKASVIDGRPALQWSLANRLFAEQRYRFQGEFLRFLQSHYGAGVESVNFSESFENARLRINAWVGEQTNERIKDLLPVGSVDALTRLVLVNALYLSAPWRDFFPERGTKEAPFYLSSGQRVATPLMRRTDEFRYVETELYQGVGVPYRFGNLQAIFVLPRAGHSLETVIPRLNGGDLAKFAVAETKTIDLSIPRFTIESPTLDLIEAFKSMGMKRAFDVPSGAADFSRMTGGRELFIGDIYHKVFLSIDEHGTEAAASTAVAMMLKGLPVQKLAPQAMVIDRPFLFALQHEPSGACLIMAAGAVPRPRD